MSKLDDEIYRPKRSEAYVPPYWEICKICRVPFKTDKFEKTCERCSVLLDERIRLFHSLLLRGFLFIIVYIGISLYWILYIIKYSSNYWFVLSVPVLLLVVGGRIFYKLLYRLNLE